MIITDQKINELKNQFKIDEILETINYKFSRILGQGGQGVVVLITDSEGNEKAIKIMKLPSSGGRVNNAKVERLKNDIAFCLQYNHDNIIRYDLHGEYPNNREKSNFLYAVMDFYPKNLRDIIDKPEDYSPKQRLDYVVQLTKAINAAHDKGVIHRDIKPENVLIKENHLVLSDFGIAHFPDSKLTVADDLLVNRNYLSPEQKIKGDALNISFASDVYSLGLIINELFTGENPAGSNYIKIEQRYPYLFELDDIVGEMMSYKPTERPTIDSVRIKLKIYKHDIEMRLDDIKKHLDTAIISSKYILQMISEDLIFADHLLKASSFEELTDLNGNYHCSISYSVTDELFSNFIQHRILTLCESKFNYESHNYLDGEYYESLNIRSNREHELIYKKMKEILLSVGGDKTLSGKVLKLFVSCVDYHCDEINRMIDNSKKNILDVPIIWLVKYLRNYGFDFSNTSRGKELYYYVKISNFRDELVATPLELALDLFGNSKVVY